MQKNLVLCNPWRYTRQQCALRWIQSPPSFPASLWGPMRAVEKANAHVGGQLGQERTSAKFAERHAQGLFSDPSRARDMIIPATNLMLSRFAKGSGTLFALARYQSVRAAQRYVAGKHTNEHDVENHENVRQRLPRHAAGVATPRCDASVLVGVRALRLLEARSPLALFLLAPEAADNSSDCVGAVLLMCCINEVPAWTASGGDRRSRPRLGQVVV